MSEKKYEAGMEVTEDIYSDVAAWCNEGGAYHIEREGERFYIRANIALIQAGTEQKVQGLEIQTGLTRVVRELVLAENSGASEYVKTTAQEIEALAEPLRTQEAGDDAGTV